MIIHVHLTVVLRSVVPRTCSMGMRPQGGTCNMGNEAIGWKGDYTGGSLSSKESGNEAGKKV